MIFSTIFRSEDEIEIFCPKCGSNNVVINHQSGFFTIEECMKCGFRRESIKKTS